MNVDGVELREIPGLNGRYFASSDGRVLSMKRKRFRTPSKQRQGYMTITVRDEITKKTTTMSVHRLVALAWIPNPENKPHINHKDGIKSNNSVPNLEWCDGSENMKHAWKNGLQPVTDAMKESARKCARISGSKRRKLTDEMIETARQRIANGESQKSLAEEFGVSTACMSERINNPYKEAA